MLEFTKSTNPSIPEKDAAHDPCGYWYKVPGAGEGEGFELRFGGEMQSVDISGGVIVFSFVDFLTDYDNPTAYIISNSVGGDRNSWELIFKESVNRGYRESSFALYETYHNGQVRFNGSNVLYDWRYQPLADNEHVPWKNDTFLIGIDYPSIVYKVEDVWASWEYPPYNITLRACNAFGKNEIGMASNGAIFSIGDFTSGSPLTPTPRWYHAFTQSTGINLESFVELEKFFPFESDNYSDTYTVRLLENVSSVDIDADGNIFILKLHGAAFDDFGVGSVYYSSNGGVDWIDVETDWDNLFSDIYTLDYEDNALAVWGVVRIDTVLGKVYVLNKTHFDGKFYLQTYSGNDSGGKIDIISNLELATSDILSSDNCAFSFSSNGDVIVVLDRGRLLRSIDGGINWTVLYSDILASFSLSVGLTNSLSAIDNPYVGLDELLFGGCVNNYGATWVLTHKTLMNAEERLVFLQSSDDGATWGVVETPVLYYSTNPPDLPVVGDIELDENTPTNSSIIPLWPFAKQTKK